MLPPVKQTVPAELNAGAFAELETIKSDTIDGSERVPIKCEENYLPVEATEYPNALQIEASDSFRNSEGKPLKNPSTVQESDYDNG